MRELRHGPLADVGTNQVEGRTGPVLAVEIQRLSHLHQLGVAQPLDLLEVRAYRPVGARERLLEPTQRLRDFVDRFLVGLEVCGIAQQY